MDGRDLLTDLTTIPRKPGDATQALANGWKKDDSTSLAPDLKQRSVVFGLQGLLAAQVKAGFVVARARKERTISPEHASSA